MTMAAEAGTKDETMVETVPISANDSVVYFIRIGKHVKIGYSRNVERRMKSYATTAVDLELIATFPGGRAEEKRLHQMFARRRVRGELFNYDSIIDYFLSELETRGLEAAWDYLDDVEIEKARAASVVEFRRQRSTAVRKSRAELDAYYASLVRERKRALGW